MSNQNKLQQLGKLFGSLGIVKRQNPQKYWASLERDFGETANKFDEAVTRRSEGEDIPVHDFKNTSLAFANRVFSQFDAERVREFTAWLIREDILESGDRVLEIGCDNGVFLCVCGLLYPDVQFKGFDSSESAVAIAEERRTSLKLKNVSFQRVSENHWGELAGESAKFVITQALMHEALCDGSLATVAKLAEFPGSQFAFNPDEEIERAPERAVKYLSVIEQMLEQPGYYISAERISTAQRFHLWTNALHDAGLKVDYMKSHKLSFTNHENDTETMPITVAEKRAANVRPRWADDFSFWIYDDFLKLKDLTTIVTPMIAEAVFSALDHQTVMSVEMTWRNGSGTMRKMFGTAGSLGYIYSATNRDVRHLILVPAVCLAEVSGREAQEVVNNFPHCDTSFEVNDDTEVSRLGLDEIAQGFTALCGQSKMPTP